MLSVIFQSCIFRSCIFSRPHWACWSVAVVWTFFRRCWRLSTFIYNDVRITVSSFVERFQCLSVGDLNNIGTLVYAETITATLTYLDVSNKPGGRLPLFSARPAVTLATLKRAAANFAAW